MILSATHIITLIIIVLVTLFFVFRKSRNIKSAEEYSVGSRKYGPAMVTGTVLGVMIGGSSTGGTAQMAFTNGLTAWWFTIGAGIAMLLLAAFYAGPLRKSGLTTVSEYISVKFGRSAGALSSVTVSLGMFFSVLASMITALNLISGLFGVSHLFSATVIALLSLAFVFYGGIGGSGTAGLIKLVLIFVSVVTGGITAYLGLGGISGIRKTFAFQPFLNIFSNGIGASATNVTAMIVGVISTQSYMQGVFAARDVKSAVKGCVISGLTIIFIGLPPVLIGLYMRAAQPDLLPIYSLPYYLCEYMPDWLGGAGIAAILFSAVGSVAGLSLGMGTTLTKDVFSYLFNICEKKQLKLDRAITGSAIIFGALGGLLYSDSLVLNWNYLSMDLRGMTIFVPMSFIIFFGRHIPKKAGMAAMAGAMFTAVFYKLFVPSVDNQLFPSLIASFLIISAYALNIRIKAGFRAVRLGKLKRLRG